MFCRNCNKELDDKAIACIGCGLSPTKEKKYCHACGEPTNPTQIVCIKCGVSLISGVDNKKQITAGMLGLLLGGLGGHKFYLGYKKEAIIMLLVSIIGSFLILPTVIMGIIGLIEGILYLTKSEEEFSSTYIDNKKGWF